MNEDKRKNKYMLITLLVVGVAIIIIGVSYAYWRFMFSSTKNNTISVSCFDVSFTDKDSISLEKAYPLYDDEGKKLTPYTFTVTNNCDTYVKYEVNLEILNTSTLTNMDYIKIMLDDETPALVSSYNVVTKTLSDASTAYKVKTGYLDAKESKTYDVRLWLDENISASTTGVQNKSFVSKITVTASYVEEIPTPTAANDIVELAKSDTANLATDNYGNTRYIGADPNNYVSIDGDIWRIVGVMKNVDDGTGKKESRIKLIRDESVGEYVWDTSEYNANTSRGVNEGNGVNEWSKSDLMKLLNPGYESEILGGSLYWNNQSGKCYNGSENSATSCDFTSTGIKDKLKALISDAVWNTGSNGTNDNTSASGGLIKHFYEYERSENTGKICSSGTYCNDTLERTTKWTGKIGLIYPSDYGYATSGDSTIDRTTCLNTQLYYWDSEIECNSSDWLNNYEDQWTLSPYAHSANAYSVFYIYNNGSVNISSACARGGVRPVVYLSSNVKISGGDGTSDLPFSLAD